MIDYIEENFFGFVESERGALDLWSSKIYCVQTAELTSDTKEPPQAIKFYSWMINWVLVACSNGSRRMYFLPKNGEVLIVHMFKYLHSKSGCAPFDSPPSKHLWLEAKLPSVNTLRLVLTPQNLGGVLTCHNRG